jgi:hypothetical protein
MKQPLQSEIVETYPQRGPMQQFRLIQVTAFHCFRCGNSKKAKLVTAYERDWDRLLCNGCYGRLLSIYEIKAGTQSEDEKATKLADELLKLYNTDQVREAERLYRLREDRAQHLSENALRFVATAEHVSQTLKTDLDWSPAVIGLCKAVETEIFERILRPLGTRLVGASLDTDTRDKDLGRVAKFFVVPNSKPPELGSFAHFLQTSLKSESRRTTSMVVGGLYTLFASWPNSAWLANLNGLYSAVVRLTQDFRNRAAHTDSLTQTDYESCREFVLGREGLLWKLVAATQPHKR